MDDDNWNISSGNNSTAWIPDCNSGNWSMYEECMEIEDETLYDVPAGVVALLSVCYGAISVVAVLGNSLVIWIVISSRRMQRSATNCFIANLALADIIIGLFAVPFQFQAALLQRWDLPEFMCAFCPFVQVLSVNVSVFTLTAIAVDRHRAVVRPLRGARPSSLRAKLTLAAIWILGGTLALPMTIAMRVSYVQHGKILKPFCNNLNLTKQQITVYRRLLVALQYFLPLCVISAVYARMGLRLWGSRAPGNAEDLRDATLLRNKKRVIKMLVIVVALFALCWLPLQTYNVLQDIYPEINGYRYINIIWFCCDWLAMSNSCYNPFIYGIYNEKFKREFRQRLRLCPRRWRRGTGLENNSVAFGGPCYGGPGDAELSDFDKTRSFRSSVHINNGNSFYRSASLRGQHSVHLCPTGVHHHAAANPSNTGNPNRNKPHSSAHAHHLYPHHRQSVNTQELSF